jgi:hypothetical protein
VTHLSDSSHDKERRGHRDGGRFASRAAASMCSMTLPEASGTS